MVIGLLVITILAGKCSNHIEATNPITNSSKPYGDTNEGTVEEKQISGMRHFGPEKLIITKYGSLTEDTGRFPGFYPIGTFRVRERGAVEAIDKLPKDKNYQLLRLPMNQMFPYYHKKSGELIGMDAIHHEHFHFKNQEK